MASKNELNIPKEDNITLEWLRKKVPLRYWISLISLIISVFLAGLYIGQQLASVKALVGINEVKKIPINTSSESKSKNEILEEPKIHIEQNSKGSHSQNIVTKGNVDIQNGNEKNK